MTIARTKSRLFQAAALVGIALFTAGPAALSAPPADAAAKPKRGLLVTVAGLAQGRDTVETEDGALLIDNMVQAAEGLRDYSFQFQINAYEKGHTVVEKGNFWYKKQRLMRLEETGDWKKGSVAVFQKNGKVRAHMGGPLSVFKVTLDPYSDELRSAHGYPMADSDFASLAGYLKNWLKEGVRSRASTDTVTLDGSTRRLKMLEMYRDGNPNQVLKRVFVDPDSYLPVEWHDFTGDRLTTKSLWTNIKTNIGLSDDLFTLKE